ncbi:SDR family NAD(P)-dependent oxidoreductase [Pedobacter sp. UYP1]|uniref:SDR family NAD(P)-dependent oxidoreductase n=1 Tax=Pedobacter sp. UYP1 TaxID=1756396 RepID=UPI003390F311
MKDRIAIITGASSGIGKSTAVKLAEKGIRMILNARDEDRLKEVEEAVNKIANNDCCRIVPGDISSAGVIDLCIKECIDTWQDLPSIFLASAGRGLPGTLISSNSEEWDELIDTNVKGLMYQLKGISKNMLELSAGRDYVKNPMDIIVIGSSIGRNVSPFNPIYGATKFAAHGLTEALRRELGPSGIRVTLVEPGLVETNFQKTAGYNEDWFKNYSKEVGPVLSGDDIAKVISFMIDLPGNVHMDNISIRPTRQAYP